MKFFTGKLDIEKCSSNLSLVINVCIDTGVIL